MNDRMFIYLFFCILSLVTLIPEPENSDNVVENTVKTDKKERTNSSVDKTNASASEQQSTTTPVKKGKLINHLDILVYMIKIFF